MSITAVIAGVGLRVLADVTGSGAASNVSGGAFLTLILPLALLALVLVWLFRAARRGWPPLPTARRPTVSRRRWRRPRHDV